MQKIQKQAFKNFLLATSILGLICVAESTFASPFAGLGKVTPGVIFKDLFKFIDDFVPSMTVLSGGAGALVAQGDPRTRFTGALIGSGVMLIFWYIGKTFAGI